MQLVIAAEVANCVGDRRFIPVGEFLRGWSGKELGIQRSSACIERAERARRGESGERAL